MTEALRLIDIKSEALGVDVYKNIPLSLVNDHNVRLSVMTEPFYWHYHPNSDETFLGVEGIVVIELEDRLLNWARGRYLVYLQIQSTVHHPKMAVL